MGKLLIVLAVVGCASDPIGGPHEIVGCEGYTGQSPGVVLQCEVACGTAENGSPPQGNGSQCMVGSGLDPCLSTFDYDGIAGCCKTVRVPPSDPVTFQIRFAVCQ